MFGLGPLEIVVIGIIAVLIFGTRIPKIARSLGKGITNFKQGLRETNIEEEGKQVLTGSGGKRKSDSS